MLLLLKCALVCTLLPGLAFGGAMAVIFSLTDPACMPVAVYGALLAGAAGLVLLTPEMFLEACEERKWLERR